MTTTTQTTTQMPPQETAQRWDWHQTIVIQLTIVLLALALQWSRVFETVGALGALRSAIATPPVNWVVVGVVSLAAVVLGIVFRRQAWMRWLSGIRFAVTVTTLVAIIGLLGTVIVQDPGMGDKTAHLGFRALFTSLPFIAAIVLMWLNLATAIGRRLAAPRPGNVGFLLNHVGLVLVLVGMLAGSSQLQKLTLQLFEGQSSSQAVDEQGHFHDLGAKITLEKFDIEKYPPKLAAAEFGANNSSQMVTDKEWVSAHHQFTPFGLTVDVLDYLPTAYPDDNGGWVKSDNDHGLPAAHIKVTTADGETKEGWVTPAIESLGIPGNSLSLNESHVVGLLEPMPKLYRSTLTIAQGNAKPRTERLEVNQPVQIGGWALYQSSYKISMMGRSSEIQVVRDPALPVVYTGFVFMLLGAFVAFWITPKRRRTPAGETAMEDATL